MYRETFPVGALGCNCSILADETTGDAIVVDPGGDADEIIAKLKTRGFKPRYLVHTHAHVDHVAGTAEVAAQAGGACCLHKGDQPLYDALDLQCQFLGLPPVGKAPTITQFLEHGDDLDAGALRLRVLHTPGHTPGSVCFLCETANGEATLFAGDTLFAGSIGRTDLWGGDSRQIIESLRDQILTLDQATLVIPGHGPNTTVGREGKVNPYLKNL